MTASTTAYNDLPGFLAIYATISEHHGKESLRTCLTDHSSEGYRQRRSIWARLPRETLNAFYTQGFCGVMATVLHQVTGWPIYGVGENADLARCTFYHVFVRQPDGRYRDVRGPDQSEADMLRAWSRPGHDPMFLAPWTADRLPFARHPEVYRLCRDVDLPRLFPDLQLSRSHAIAC